MAVYDPGHLLDDAEQEMTRAATQAVDAWLVQARADVLGDSGAPDLEGWPAPSVWVRLIDRFLMPVIERLFGEAFAAAARSDLLQIHTHRTRWMAQAHDRLSASLWPSDAYEQIRGALAAGVDSGASIPQLRADIADRLGVDRYAYVAERIARTEAHAAVEAGTYAAEQEWAASSGEEIFRMWWATPGPRTRAAHANAHGQVVALGEPFTVGGATLRFPGDPAAPPSLSINCRCTAIYGLADELAELAPDPISAAGGSMPTEHPLMWRGVLAPLEVRGDFRVLAEPADGKVLTTDLMWLSYQEKSAGGHDGKIAVGRVDRAWIANGMVWGEGPFDASDPAAVEVARKVGERFAGTVSVDLAEGDFELRFYDADDQPITGEVDPAGLEDGTVQELVYVTNWRLGGVTLVQDPAFGTSRDGKASARIWMVEPLEGAMTAAATGNTMLPLADRDREWDGDAAKRRLADAGRLNSGCFWRDDDADPDSDIQADYRLPFADIIDGELVAVPRGIFAVASVLQGGMGGVDLPQEAQDAIRDRVEDYYDRMRAEWDDPSVRAPWDDEDDDDEGETMAASAATGTTWAEKVADAVPVHPPKHWFSDPQLTGLTKVRITDEGRVYGHIADWTQTHIGHMGQRVYPPRCPDGGTYPRFHRHPVRTAEGDRINTGPLTTAGHASTDANVTMGAAMAHYDDPRFVLANVVVGEDEHGIWVAGALRPGVEPWQVAFGDTYSFSGDWRNGNLVAACAVSVPGFHLPSDDTVAALAASAGVAPDTAQVRSRVDDGQVVALVSAGVIAPAADQARTLGRQDVHRLLAAIDTSATHVQTLAADIGDTVYTAMRRALADHEADQAIIGQLAADLGVE